MFLKIKIRLMNIPIATIPVDSIYTPVKRVNFTVENTRVGQITDYDKLTLKFGLMELLNLMKLLVYQLKFLSNILNYL